MPNSGELCHSHSGCINDIDNLKSDSVKQWEELGTIRGKVDSIMARLNVILGCVVVAVIMLLINLSFKIV